MKKTFSMLAVFCLAMCACSPKNEVILSLQGEWNFKLDREDVGIKEAWYKHNFTDTINLPGSLQEQGYGDPPSLETEWIGSIINEKEYQQPKYDKYKQPDNFKFPFWLTPDRYYKGVAWYQKEVALPENWRSKRVFLDLERCHWATTVFVDGQLVGSDSSLSVPHRYELTSALNEIPGKHTLTIRVDNRMIVNVGPNSHSVSDHTQSNWNGIVGKIQLRAVPAGRIQDVKIYSDIEAGSVKVKVRLGQDSPNGKLILRASSSGTQTNQVLPPISVPVEGDFIEVDYPMGETPLLWDEFEPNLYKMNVRFEATSGVDEKEVLFGMRKVETRGTRIYVNNRPTFMRGTLECAIFPKTGYPAMDAAEWERIFDVVKSYGLNHMRFHSWCPPEAAFIAADRKGVYLHVEGPSWANWGTSLGDGLPIDQYIYSESERILREYGNHPSFIMYAYGNEPGGKNHKKFLADFVTFFKNKDNRRLYTSGAGWPIIPENDFLSYSDPRIQRWGEGLNSVINAQAPNTQFNHEEIIAQYDRPMIAHEIGQWCVYPNFDEIPKYTGVLKAKNFEIFRDFLEANHMGHQARDFFMASGKLQALCYKADIEAALRTPDFGGFQLLDLHDFPGQGTALVGVVDPFWDEKDYISPEEYSRFCSTTVPLALMPARTWTTSDTFVAEIQISHFGKQEIPNAEVSWTILAGIQNEVKSGEFESQTIGLDNCQTAGKIRLPLAEFSPPQKLELVVTVEGYGQNSWDFWVYPDEVDVTVPDGIIVTKALTPEIVQQVEEGADVLLLLHGKIKEGKGAEVAVGFSSVFWNTAWTTYQAPHTMGILCNPDHPLFAAFPTEFHSNWQWWDIVTGAQAMNLEGFPPELQPSIQLIDTWFEARRLALLFEGKIGNGRIIVTSIDFESRIEERLGSRQLYASLLNYMESEYFEPRLPVASAVVQNLVQKAK